MCVDRWFVIFWIGFALLVAGWVTNSLISVLGMVLIVVGIGMENK